METEAVIPYLLATWNKTLQVEVPKRAAYRIANLLILQAFIFVQPELMDSWPLLPSPTHRSPVNPATWPNLGCTPSKGPLFSHRGKEMALQEANMAARQASSNSLKSIAGALLLALGLAFLFGNLEGIAACINNFAGISAHDAVGIVPALGLAGMHAVQAYAFDRDAFLSGLRQNLVSFWPLLVVAIGAGLLKSGLDRRLTRPGASAGSSATESHSVAREIT